MGRQRDGQVDRWVNRWKDDRWKDDRWVNRQIGRQIDGQIDRWVDRQMGR